jgi:hypothetical protein
VCNGRHTAVDKNLLASWELLPQKKSFPGRKIDIFGHQGAKMIF